MHATRWAMSATLLATLFATLFTGSVWMGGSVQAIYGWTPGRV